MAQSSLSSHSSNQAYFHVSALEGGLLTFPTHLFVTDISDHSETVYDYPSLAFFLRHSQSNHLIVFDLGIRKDFETLPPAIQERIKIFSPLSVPRSVEQSLRKGGINPEDVDTVILSHLHWDHTGDHTSFTKAHFILGEGSDDVLANAYPTNPNSLFVTSSVPVDRTRVLVSSDYTTSIGPFPRAFDYFGDGSLYIIDAFGHMQGHINVLARTSPSGSWIYLAGDSAHDRRLISGEKSIRVRYDEQGCRHCNHVDKNASEEHLKNIKKLIDEEGEKAEVILAHDWEWYHKNKATCVLPGVIPPKT